MLFFIPAWYQQNQWCENEQRWSVRRMHTEFDDTVKQIQLFHRNKAYPYQIMLLSFAPNLRHFLHRQGVYRAPYWSCFDAIQEVRRKKTAVLSFHKLKWPEGIEFVYTPFVVVAMLNKEKYAQIEFGEDGNPIRIDLYQKGQIRRRNLYDDRGFVSGTVIYEDGQPFYQDYLMENGIWKLRHFLRDGHAEINGQCPEYLLKYQEEVRRKRFARLRYDSMEQVIAEVLNAYLSMTEPGDIFCAAMHGRHAGLLGECLKEKKLILSFFEDRYPLAEAAGNLDLIREADYLIADSRKNVDRIQQALGMLSENIIAIPPYDSRVDVGISQQFSVQKILVAVDGLEDERFAELVGLLGRYLRRNENARVHLFTRRAEYDRKKKVLEQARRELGGLGFDEGWAAEEEKGQVAENDLELHEKVPVKFFVEQCVDELAVNKCMREQRVLVDLADGPDLFLQICCVSMGIPQILKSATEYMRPGKNGRINSDLSRLGEDLAYYLESLNNWNQAVIHSYELGKSHTTQYLIEQWKEVIVNIENGTGAAAGGGGF